MRLRSWSNMNCEPTASSVCLLHLANCGHSFTIRTGCVNERRMRAAFVICKLWGWSVLLRILWTSRRVHCISRTIAQDGLQGPGNTFVPVLGFDFACVGLKYSVLGMISVVFIEAYWVNCFLYIRYNLLWQFNFAYSEFNSCRYFVWWISPSVVLYFFTLLPISTKW